MQVEPATLKFAIFFMAHAFFNAIVQGKNLKIIEGQLGFILFEGVAEQRKAGYIFNDLLL